MTLSCPTCGAKLHVTRDIERFACAHCGNEHVVRRAGGIVTLAPVIEALRRLQRGMDRTAAELALRRLKEEVAERRRLVFQLADGLCRRNFALISAELHRLGFLSTRAFRQGERSSVNDLELRRNLLVGLTVEQTEKLAMSLRRRPRFVKQL